MTKLKQGEKITSDSLGGWRQAMTAILTYKRSYDHAHTHVHTEKCKVSRIMIAYQIGNLLWIDFTLHEAFGGKFGVKVKQ